MAVNTETGTVSPQDDRPRFSAIPGMDPGADWLLGPGLRDFMPPGGDALIPFLLQIEDEAALAEVNGLLARSARGVRPSGALLLPGVAPNQRGVVRPSQGASALASLAFFEALARGNGLRAIRAGPKRIQLGLPLPASRVAPRGPDGVELPLADPPVRPPAGGWQRGTVVVGVIDDGIAFAHQRFRAADGGTRIQAFWHQDGIPAAAPTVGNGRELGKAEIDQLLGDAGWVDEDQVYRRAGLADFADPLHKSVAWRLAHGTHVLDLAAGYDPAEDRTDRPIIAVQLPVASTAGQSGAGLEPHVLNAVHYILDRARRLTRPDEAPLPVVINFSYGTHAGPHDGTSLLEQAIDQVVTDAGAPVRVVLPAGNTHASRCHAQVSFKRPGEVTALPVRVQPDDQTPSRVEVWLPFAGPDGPAQSRVSLMVEAPDGTQSPWIDEDAGQAFDLGAGPYCRGVYSFQPAPTARGVFRIDLQPTARVQPGAAGPVAPSGRWIIRLRNASLVPDDAVHMWIERDDVLPGYGRRGRQSYFDDPAYVRFDRQGRPIEDDPAGATSPVRRAGMVNAIATGQEPAVAGGFAAKDLRVAPYSAGGPVTPAQGGEPAPCQRKPDALLVSDASRVHAGVLAAGSRSGALVAMNGTSVAAPQLARWIADRLAAGKLSDRAAVRQAAEAAEALLPGTKPPLPPERGGWGRMGRADTGPRARVWT